MKSIKLMFIAFALFAANVSTMEQSGSLPELVQSTLFQRYNIKPRDCRVAINREFDIPFSSWMKGAQIACLVAGLKDVYLADSLEDVNILAQDPLVRELFNQQYISHIYLYAPSAWRTGNIIAEEILYTPKGERNGLLLAKKMLTFELEKFENKPFSGSAYLTGELLGYKPEDQEFFEKLQAFQGYLLQEKNIPITEIDKQFPFRSFQEWPEKSKTEFLVYETQIWPESQEYKRFEVEKRKASNWLQENSSFTTEQLRQQVNDLLEALKKFEVKSD